MLLSMVLIHVASEDTFVKHTTDSSLQSNNNGDDGDKR